jgi:acyl-coenzyme A synthetase/AMP-(fatty) acid ligase
MIIDRIHQWARTEPNKPALIHNDFIIDYITFAKTIEAFRKVLEQWHLPVGTIAVVLVGHLADAWALVMALRALGLTTIHVQSLVQANALLLKNVSCVVTTAREQLENNLDRNPLPGAKLIVLSRNDLAATPVNDLPPSPPNDRPSGGHILYTSGTTGAYRKLLWDSEREEARSSERGRFQDFDKHTMAHILRCAQHTGIGWKIPLAVWQVGGCVVMDQRPERYEQLFRHSVTYVFMTPLMFRRLVATDRINPAASPNCDFRIGGGGVGSDLVTKALTRFGDTINLYHGYASSELAISALASRLRSGDDALWLEPVADRTVQIVDESGHECSLGQEGDLRVRTTELDWQSYLDDDEATARVFRDGFFYPGDRAVRRADGRIRVLGRVADVLNVRVTRLQSDRSSSGSSNISMPKKSAHFRDATAQVRMNSLLPFRPTVHLRSKSSTRSAANSAVLKKSDFRC